MTDLAPEKDLVVLVADGQMEFAVRGLLARSQSLEFQKLSADSVDFRVHPHRDPGCLLRSHDFLRPFYRQYRHAIVMLDREGCGREGDSRQELEREIERQLSSTGWDDRAAAIVLDPELEVWVWSDSPEVDAVLGWVHTTPRLAEWLQNEGYSVSGQTKPNRPKEVMERVL